MMLSFAADRVPLADPHRPINPYIRIFAHICDLVKIYTEYSSLREDLVNYRSAGLPHPG